MTARELISKEIIASQRYQKPALILGLGSFGLILLSPVFVIPAFIGAMMLIYSYVALSKSVRCPYCQKSLGYLLNGAGYAKGPFIFPIPEELPSHITACPFCKEDLTGEVPEEFLPDF